MVSTVKKSIDDQTPMRGIFTSSAPRIYGLSRDDHETIRHGDWRLCSLSLTMAAYADGVRPGAGRRRDKRLAAQFSSLLLLSPTSGADIMPGAATRGESACKRYKFRYRNLLGAGGRTEAGGCDQVRYGDAERAQALAQHLAPLPEGRLGNRFEGPAVALKRRRARQDLHQRGCDLRRRHEGGRVYIEEYPRLAAPLHQDGEASVALRSGLGDDALGDLALEHEGGGVIPGRPRLHDYPSDQQGRRDVVGQIGDDASRALREARAWIERERIGRYDVQTAGVVFGDLPQSGKRAVVALDRDHAGGAKLEERAGQSARAGTDLDYAHAREWGGRARYARREIEIKKEVLPERFPGDDAVSAYDLAKRRQVRAREVSDTPSRAGVSALARRAPRRSAAIKLVASARPLPAMSNAVPWSGEVRTKGRPSVTLTAWSNASVLIGISAWS